MGSHGVSMKAHKALGEVEEGDKITVDGYNQTFTVEKVMFDGEMVDIVGPQGGEKSLVQNVNSGVVRMTVGGTNKGVVSEINV